MTVIFVKPAVAGAVVRNPDRQMERLPEAGDYVPDNAYWRRRVDDGDVVLASAPPPPRVVPEGTDPKVK